ncbi:hypothetical protein QBC46DRAFT_424983 [Diplogelasinospora grovesii]|uniref:SET domain-containing protein n=1 Tax=Diplogelasinospora grovesii TaxID=303347 RepID=A0AAN6NJL4_9PEZI|nr:hypothetical protein QBC46DRAFT_424983 [Diplogelasinospora grovesii]
MSRPDLPIEALPAWTLLNDITFHDVKVAETEESGYGLVSERNLSTQEETFDVPTLITVPHSLVLNVECVEEYAKEDRNFRQLLDAAGHQSTRGDILLFLLVQTALASRSSQPAAGVSNPWTEYLKFLPAIIPVPTLWTEDELHLLRGTSLEAAVGAKLSALEAEFDAVRESSSGIPCWNEMLWVENTVSLGDWILLDALYRSRCLELPRSGESMVPCIDMVNHSASPTAYYDENSKDEVVLSMRPGTNIFKGQEVTISYGDTKSPAEMLFSYGFIDPGSTAQSLVLPLEPFPDDPLAKAKLVAFGEPPKIHMSRSKDGTTVDWKSPFAYLMCVNEEDGLEFRVLQETDGSRQLRVFWQDQDVTTRTTDFGPLIQSHQLSAILRLRVATVIQQRLQDQLDRLTFSHIPDVQPLAAGYGNSSPREACIEASLLLREVERGILETGIQSLEKQVSAVDPSLELMADENVVAYLGSMETAESDLANQEASNEEDEDDFS